jgi:hypothetical protein
VLCLSVCVHGKLAWFQSSDAVQSLARMPVVRVSTGRVFFHARLDVDWSGESFLSLYRRRCVRA